MSWPENICSLVVDNLFSDVLKCFVLIHNLVVVENLDFLFVLFTLSFNYIIESRKISLLSMSRK